MLESQVEKLRALILQQLKKIPSSYGVEDIPELVPMATDESLLRGCLKLIVSFGLWVEDYLQDRPVVQLSSGKLNTNSVPAAMVDTETLISKLLFIYGNLALDERSRQALQFETGYDRVKTATLVLNLYSLMICIASARLVEADLPTGEVDESILPADYQYMIHPSANQLVYMLLQLKE